MSRLYYEPQFTNAARDAEEPNRTKEYLDKVASLIPAEIVAAYLTLSSLSKSVENYEQQSLMGAFLFCLIITPFYLNYMSAENKPKTKHIAISTISFVVWAYVISGDEVGIYYNGALSSMFLIIYSLIVGLVKLDK